MSYHFGDRALRGHVGVRRELSPRRVADARIHKCAGARGMGRGAVVGRVVVHGPVVQAVHDAAGRLAGAQLRVIRRGSLARVSCASLKVDVRDERTGSCHGR